VGVAQSTRGFLKHSPAAARRCSGASRSTG
jgi:hypothetical protein